MNKTLICVLSETRASKLSWPSFKHNVIDSLKADLALCISVPDDYNYSDPFWQFAKYRWTTKEFADWGSALDEAQISACKGALVSSVDWRTLLSIQDNWLGGVIESNAKRAGSGAILLFFRWLLVKHLLNEGILDRYDRFIITRSDFIWPLPHPPLDILTEQHIWIPDGESYGGITDRHAVLSKQNIIDYLSVTDLILKDTENLKVQLKGVQKLNLESYIATALKKNGAYNLIQFFPYAMYTARECLGKTSWSTGVWSEELGYHIKYPSEFEFARQLSEVVETLDDWRKIFTRNSGRGFKSRVLTKEGMRIALIGQQLGVLDDDLWDDGIIMELTIDFIQDKGMLYLESSQFGALTRQLVGHVKLVETNNGCFKLRSARNNGFFVINPKKTLQMDAVNYSEFRFKNRYLRL